MYGLCTYNPKTDLFTTIEYLGNSFISDILQTSDGNIWFATLGNGLHKYNPRTHVWSSYEHIAGDSTSLPSNKVITLFEDSNTKLWIGTEGGGLCSYKAATSTFKTYTTKEGLPNNIK
ncbi:MAG: hypothetical protein LUD02_09660 [Tannerellaceae bacterium]|nr:hypothetical protein [Tannerellaceae bacterium]MCD8264373.1 hypothetical protein [Tannerellaceae bacterium]